MLLAPSPRRQNSGSLRFTQTLIFLFIVGLLFYFLSCFIAAFYYYFLLFYYHFLLFLFLYFIIIFITYYLLFTSFSLFLLFLPLTICLPLKPPTLLSHHLFLFFLQLQLHLHLHLHSLHLHLHLHPYLHLLHLHLELHLRHHRSSCLDARPMHQSQIPTNIMHFF